MVFGPVFAPPIPATFDRHAAAAAAAAPAWWYVAGKTCVAAYQPKGAASLAASYSNLAQPGTYDAAPGVAPTWASATGWTFNGTNQYLATGITAISNTWTMLVQFSGGSSSGDRCLVGGYNGSGTADFSLWQITAGKSYYNNNQLLASANYITTGNLALAGKAAYKDGVADGTITGGAVSSAVINIGRAAGINLYYYAGSIQAIAIYSATLTAGEVAAVSAAMAAL